MIPMKAAVSAALLLAGCAAIPGAMEGYEVQGDAIPHPLTQTPGDPARGRAVIAGRDGNCLLCHSLPEAGERFMGNVGPPLSHVASRLSAPQMRLRIVDPTRVNGDAVMPAYYRTRALERVALEFSGKPILSAQQVEDVIAYLQTLR